MRLKIIFVLLLVLSFIHPPAFAQLGPKDGTDLSATDLQRIKVGQPAPDFTLEDMEGQIITVSVDSHEDSKKFAKMMQVRFEGEFDFPLLEDRDHKVINRYGIFNPDGRGWPHPATYIIDPQGVVRWQFIEVDYKKRASNELIRRELAKIK